MGSITMAIQGRNAHPGVIAGQRRGDVQEALSDPDGAAAIAGEPINGDVDVLPDKKRRGWMMSRVLIHVRGTTCLPKGWSESMASLMC